MKTSIFITLLSIIALANAKLVMIIRHGEKISDDYTDLSPRGKARADCLINVFGSNGTYVSPQKIYAQSPSEKKLSTRPRDTVVPLAQSLGLQLDLTYESGKTKKLTGDILSSNDEIVLISWSNDKIPKIAESLGVVNPPEWNNNVFDEIWMISDGTTPYTKNTMNSGSTAASNTNTVTNGSLNKRQSGLKLTVVKQEINQCITQTMPKYKSSTTTANTSGSAKSYSVNLFIGLVSLILYLCL